MSVNITLPGESFSVAIIERILRILEEEGSKKKTHLAARANLNYSACMRYLAFLKGLRCIDFESTEGGMVRIKDEGRLMRESLKGIAERPSTFTPENSGFMPSIQRNTASAPSSDSDTFVASNKLGSRITDTSQVGGQPKRVERPVNILLLDDDEDILTTYKLLINEAGFNVRTFTNAQRALRDLKKYPQNYYDVIITDIRMRPMNGLQFYKEIKRLSLQVKVMFISALDAADEILSVFPDVNVNQVIRKPVERTELLNKLRWIAE